MQKEQWHHEQSQNPHFMQFIGPSHPLVTARYSDVNQDGHADYYDGFLDFTLREIKSDLENGATRAIPAWPPRRSAAMRPRGWAGRRAASIA